MYSCARSYRYKLALDLQMTLTEAVTNTWPNLWPQLNQMKQNYFVKLFKQLGYADLQEHMVPAKLEEFYAHRTAIEKILRDLAAAPDQSFYRPENMTRNVPFVKPQIQTPL